MVSRRMTKKYLLTVLMEEGGEVVQAAAKCQRFGWSRHEPGYGVNHEVLAKEIGDLLGVADALGLDRTLVRRNRASKMERVYKAAKERNKR
jgi:NTP pyrophosphatase (non-canonical NTP hydrolase)